jgi:hypothetical protein
MKKVSAITLGMALFSVFLSSCTQGNSSETVATTTDSGTLALVANGEDFVRQGFVSKDGWSIKFDRVYLNVSDVTAYQMESSFEPNQGDTLENVKYSNKVSFLDTVKTIDLAAGETNAEPILVEQTEAPVGFYNAIAWKLTTIAGKTIGLQGQATKEGQIINFDLGFNRPVEYLCGEFVGDDRKGIVEPDQTGQLETTLHFDHVFGDSQTAADDALNQDALGFQPLADLAYGDRLKLEESTLSAKLSPENYQKLTNALVGLGHVGEGHCQVVSK